MGFWPVVKKVIKDSDIVVLLLDVRMPEFFKNREVERLANRNNKKMMTVFTKIDLVTTGFLASVKKTFPDALFVSGTKNIGISKLKTALLIEAKRKKIDEPFVGVVGYPNVGKSSVINALAKRAKAKTGRMAGVTRGIQWIKAGSLKILDSPGVVPVEDSAIKLGMMGAKNPEKLRDPERVVYALFRMLREHTLKGLADSYKIDLDEDEDEDEILEKIARKRGYLKKGGEIEIHRTAMTILRDWQKGKIRV
ncbi:MAG: hypothetical protein CL811_01215 [Colwelliaceae bacterium]|nr:hypothetical protein [Colwelliaceae bacterium]|tara:strand:+ start:863 stop:1615 length:753 start_codon:yes stop_codon:yes gene_type:complete